MSAKNIKLLVVRGDLEEKMQKVEQFCANNQLVCKKPLAVVSELITSITLNADDGIVTYNITVDGRESPCSSFGNTHF